jgi:hypothetical protein
LPQAMRHDRNSNLEDLIRRHALIADHHVRPQSPMRGAIVVVPTRSVAIGIDRTANRGGYGDAHSRTVQSARRTIILYPLQNAFVMKRVRDCRREQRHCLIRRVRVRPVSRCFSWFSASFRWLAPIGRTAAGREGSGLIGSRLFFDPLPYPLTLGGYLGCLGRGATSDSAVLVPDFCHIGGRQSFNFSVQVRCD